MGMAIGPKMSSAFYCIVLILASPLGVIKCTASYIPMVDIC